MMNADLVARSLAVGVHAMLLVAEVVVAAGSGVALAGIVAVTFQSVCAVLKSVDAMEEKSLRRIGSVAMFLCGVVMLGCCGVLASSASAGSASKQPAGPYDIVPKYALDSLVVASVVGLAVYTVAELVGIFVRAVATVIANVIMAVPSVVSTSFEFVLSPLAAFNWRFVWKTLRKAFKKKKNVSFGKVRVQEYRVTLGDHPLCKRYPMTLDWSHDEAKECDLDAFEQAKVGRPKLKRMQPQARRARIAQVTGVCPSVVQMKEHVRRQKVKDAKKASAKVKKSLSFGTVQVREYSLTLGDHPCCKSYPLSLDWGHTEAKEYDLDRLEQAKAAAEPRPDLTPEQRLARIASVTGFCPSLVEKKERRRVRKLEAAEKEAALAHMDLFPHVSRPRRSGKSLSGFNEV